MLPLLYCEQGATAPVGRNGGITVTRVTGNGGWTATPYFGGTALASVTRSRYADALQGATVILSSYYGGLGI